MRDLSIILINVPQRDPASISAEIERRGGDNDHVATADVASLTYGGVKLDSRWNRAHELQVMGAMVEAVGPRLRTAIESIFCDSKASNTYDIRLKAGQDEGTPRAVADAAAAVCFLLAGGYNFLTVSLPDGEQIALDPDWEEASLDLEVVRATGT